MESAFYFIFNGLKNGGGFEDLYYNNVSRVREALLKNGFAQVDDMIIYNDYYYTTAKHIEVRLYPEEITIQDKKYKRYTLNRFISTDENAIPLIKNINKMETAC